jgi:hypothetical protein
MASGDAPIWRADNYGPAFPARGALSAKIRSSPRYRSAPDRMPGTTSGPTMAPWN